MSSRLVAIALCAAGVVAPALPASAQRTPIHKPTGLAPDVLALACAPTAAREVPATPLRITGGQSATARRNYSPGDLVTINAGAQNGIEVGQEYYVRRLQVAWRQAVTPDTPGTIRTVGWIRVYAVADAMSLATITHACDAMEIDDYLEPFALPTVPTPSADRPKPERDNYARVLQGMDRRVSFGGGDFLTIDRGSAFGITPGSRFVLYRDKRVPGNFLYDLGEAVAVDVKEQSATLHVTVARDAIQAGDYVALRRP